MVQECISTKKFVTQAIRPTVVMVLRNIDHCAELQEEWKVVTVL
jgi:hypothetical protein